MFERRGGHIEALLVFGCPRLDPAAVTRTGGSKQLPDLPENLLARWGSEPLCVDCCPGGTGRQARNPFRQCREGVSVVSRADFKWPPGDHVWQRRHCCCAAGPTPPSTTVDERNLEYSPDVDEAAIRHQRILRRGNDSVAGPGSVHCRRLRLRQRLSRARGNQPARRWAHVAVDRVSVEGLPEPGGGGEPLGGDREGRAHTPSTAKRRLWPRRGRRIRKVDCGHGSAGGAG